MPKKTNKNPISEEKFAESTAEVEAHLDSEASQEEAASSPDEQAQKAAEAEKATDTDVVVPAEVAAIHVVKEKPQTVDKKETVKKEPTKKVKSKVEKSKRSKRYSELSEKVEKGKLYLLPDAVKLIKELSTTKFDSTVEVHVRLNKKKAKGSTESSRGTVHLPHGSGKERKVIVLDEKKIDEIAKTKKIDFDIAIAAPDLMPKVAKIAKILGPKGKMPDPKSGTVTTDPSKVMAEITSGKTEYRIDSNDIVHQIVGKVSWSDDKLIDNIKAVLTIAPKSRLATVHITSSIAPSIPLDINKV